MKSTITFVILTILLILPAGLFAQGSWADDFNGPTVGTGWYENDHYSLSQSDGALAVSVRKTAMWASFGVNIPVQNFTANPVVNLSLKTGQPFLLSMYLFSAAGNVITTQTIMPSAQFAVTSFDFTGLDVSNKVLNAVTGIGFAVNGAGLSWEGTVYFDNLTAGSSATKYANLGALPDMTFFQGSIGHKIFVRGINHAATLILNESDNLLENVTIDPISPEGTAFIHFDCKAGVDNTETALLTATGDDGYTNNYVNFSITVEGNRTPTLSDIPATKASVGKVKTIELEGITDGNSSIDQVLLVSAESLNTDIIGNPVTVSYDEGSRYAKLTFTPVTAGTSTISVTINDQSSADNLITKTFDVEVLGGWNAQPTLEFLPNTEVLNTAGEQTILLKGISDGDNGTQTLEITATSSNAAVIPDPVISFTGGKTAELKYTPVNGTSGVVIFTVTVNDNGGAADNNGNQSFVRTFKVETYDAPLSGYVIPFTGVTPDAYGSAQAGKRDYWYVEGMGTTQNASFVKDGADDVFQVACTGKSTWSGSWYYTPDMDLTDFPLMSMWVKCDQAIRVHIYFWDDSIRNNEDHHLEFPLVANTWTKLNFDFSDAKGMLNNKGQHVNAKRITRVLFNYHPNYNWPFTNWTGTVQFKDLRIGDKSGITPTYYCTVDPVGPHAYYNDSELKTISLKGISRGKDKLAQVEVSSKGILSGLNVSAVSNGEAIIAFTPSLSGNDTIKVTVSGTAIDGKVPVSTVIKIPVSVTDKSAASPSLLTINAAQTHQTFRGLGAKNPSPNLLEKYTVDFGASAIRFGILDDNQVEPVNDNEDPNVLDMNNLNYDAFDWTYVRNLKARGVETFLVTFWSPPAWMKENLSTNYQQPAALQWEQTTNKVLTAMYDEYAEDAVAVVKMFKQEAGIDLAGIGLQNEPAFCEPYGSAILSPDKFADMIVRVGKRFEAEGITTKLYAAEQVGGIMSDGPIYSHASYLAAFDQNAEVKKYSDVFAVHGYASDGITPGDLPGSTGWANVFAAINANGKTRELWMTETEPAFANWMDAFTNSANILTAFESGDVSLWTEWAWDGHCIDKGKATQKLWAQSMFSFIRPGAKRITSASGNNDILITSWVNDAEHGGKTVMVLMNKGLQPLTVSITQASMPQKYTVYRCSENIARYKDNSYTKGEKLLIGSNSMVTLVSGTEGEPTIDPVADLIIFTDEGQVNVPLSNISDGYDVNQYPVLMNYSVSENTVISGVVLIYDSPQKTGTFSFSPATKGTTEISLSVTANGVTTTEKFTVIVKDYNLPTINAVTENLLLADNSGNKIVNLGGINDGGDGGQALTVSAEVTSSTPAGVLENLVVNYTSPASTGTLSFSPAAAGNAEITVTVADNGPDGKNTKTTVFSVEVFSTVGIANSLKEKVRLYPSPASDRIFVESPEGSYNKYSVFTSDGMLVKNGVLNGTKTELNVSSLAKGYYLLMLEGKEKPVVINFIK
jgi:O-glycosyl hydrolase